LRNERRVGTGFDQLRRLRCMAKDETAVTARAKGQNKARAPGENTAIEGFHEEPPLSGTGSMDVDRNIRDDTQLMSPPSYQVSQDDQICNFFRGRLSNGYLPTTPDLTLGQVTNRFKSNTLIFLRVVDPIPTAAELVGVIECTHSNSIQGLDLFVIILLQ
jgi:hypothetical protein